jgi:hypothetical protein
MPRVRSLYHVESLNYMFNKIDIDLLCNFYLLQIMLAEKQAALEKLEWEANVSNTKVEELQVDVASMDVEVSALMKLFREISENGRAPHPRDRTDGSSLECEPVQLDVS